MQLNFEILIQLLFMKKWIDICKQYIKYAK